MACRVRITKTPQKYLDALDKTTRKRITDKIMAIAENPTDSRLSYPLTNKTKRASRVGGYRILFEIASEELIVADIGPRGQIYRKV